MVNVYVRVFCFEFSENLRPMIKVLLKMKLNVVILFNGIYRRFIMSKSKKYFYIAVILLIVSFYFNTFNPLLSMQFQSIKNLLIACSIVNVVILIASIIFSDKAIKHLNNKNKDWLKMAAKVLPYVILVVILFHIFASVTTFGIFS